VAPPPGATGRGAGSSGSGNDDRTSLAAPAAPAQAADPADALPNRLPVGCAADALPSAIARLLTVALIVRGLCRAPAGLFACR
jgi:hypothetical protein